MESSSTEPSSLELVIQVGGLLSLLIGVTVFAISQRDRIRQHINMVVYEVTHDKAHQGEQLLVDVSNFGSAPITGLHCRVYEHGHRGRADHQIGHWSSAIVLRPGEARRAVLIDGARPPLSAREVINTEPEVEVVCKDVYGRWWLVRPGGRPKRLWRYGKRVHRAQLVFQRNRRAVRGMLPLDPGASDG
jgi:hypothetical protein